MAITGTGAAIGAAVGYKAGMKLSETEIGQKANWAAAMAYVKTTNAVKTAGTAVKDTASAAYDKAKSAVTRTK